MAKSTACLSALLIIVSLAVFTECALVVQNQEVPHSKEIKSQAAQVLLRQSGPVQSLPMVSLYKYHTRHELELRKNSNSACSCQGMQCGCCLRLQVEKIGLNDTGCVNVTYLSKELGFEFTLSIDGIVLIDKKISVSNPPPLCAAIPYLKKLASACVQFHDLHFHDKQFSGCVSIEIMVATEVLVKYDVGCFHIPPTFDAKKLEPSHLMWMKMQKAQESTKKQTVYSPNKPHTLKAIKDLELKGNSLCACEKYDCGCCVHMQSKKISLNETGCVNVSYLPSEIGFEFKVTLNGKIIIDDKVSVSNPPPFCMAVPYLHQLASVCAEFRDLKFQDRQFSGCSSLIVKLAGVTVENFDLGCFHFPPKHTARTTEFTPLLIIN
ncbi:hypothetical protein ElyMa_005141500 [Elysia marginata]|uniref:DUF4773 domain-containing protein n=1 Tax=Elysia marginata TaxID=1093978 RepID=A0AAV4JS79_9GAST|nr:hypothetical protein ElyMa_005141500 [Elysia marginata]